MENENQRALTPKRTKRAAIADLPENVSVFAIQKPTGTKWRVQLGKRFTGGRRSIFMRSPRGSRRIPAILGRSLSLCNDPAAGSMLA